MSMRRLPALVLTLLVLGCLGVLLSVGHDRPLDPFLAAIQRRSMLRVGMDPTYPPFDTLVNRQPAGYDAELARALASDLGVQIHLETFALDSLYDSLQLDQTDLLISALPVIPERMADVHYSIPYYQAGQVIVVRAGDKEIAARAGLAGKKVGVELGSEADTQARRLARTDLPTMQLISAFRSPEDSFSALLSRSVDAVIADNPSSQAYGRRHPNSIAILSPSLTDEPYVVAMPARATQLAARVDATIARLQASGQLMRLMGESNVP